MYPFTELLTGFLMMAAFIKFGLGAEFALAVCLIFFALAAGLTDLFTALDTKNFECGLIPDAVILPGLVCGFVTSYLVHGSLLFPLYGTAVGFIALFVPSFLYKLIRKREGMGMGDLYLVAMCGSFLGLKSIYFLVFGSALLGAVAGIIWQKSSGRKDMMIPFGPFISASAVIYLFFETIVNKVIYGI